MSTRCRPAGPSRAMSSPESLALASCTACWHEVSIGASRCPACGADTVPLSRQSYERKLWIALKHPNGEVRQRAAVLLGEVSGPDARGPLLVLAEAECDPYLAAAALKGLQSLTHRHALQSIDWRHFAQPGHPLPVRFTAVQILKNEGLVPSGPSGREIAR
jgi:hypothetical protein